MNREGPMSDQATTYRIEMRGRLELDWLQSFAEGAQVLSTEAAPGEEITVVHVQADQSGAVGLLRRLHGLGISILLVQAVPDRGPGASAKEED